MIKRPSLDDLAAAASVADHRSFRRAADALDLSASTLSHVVRGLEDRLGVRLLHRTTRSVMPTQAGAAFFSRLQPLLRELDAVLAEASSTGAQVQGTLRITAGQTGAEALLERIVPVFRTAHPAASLELVTQEELVDLVAGGFDAGVRLAEAVPPDMVAVPLGPPARFLAVASPRYLAGRGVPDTPEALREHDCIRFRLRSGRLYRWEFARRDEELAVEVAGPLTVDSMRVAMRAAASGLGIAFGPEREAAPFLRDGTLVAVLEEWCPSWPGLQLCYPLHRHMTPTLRAFLAVARAEGRSQAE